MFLLFFAQGTFAEAVEMRQATGSATAPAAEDCDKTRSGPCDDPKNPVSSIDALPLQMILNADINSTLITHDGNSHNRTGRVSTYLTRQSGKSAEFGFTVNAVNIVYFGVPQEMVTGKKPSNKPTGVFGFTLDHETAGSAV